VGHRGVGGRGDSGATYRVEHGCTQSGGKQEKAEDVEAGGDLASDGGGADDNRTDDAAEVAAEARAGTFMVGTYGLKRESATFPPTPSSTPSPV